MNKKLISATAITIVLALVFCWQASAEENRQQELSKQTSEQLVQKSRDAYTIFDRTDISKTLAAKGIDALPELTKALDNAHWHVRHCSLMALKELAKTETNRDAIKPSLKKLTELLLKDPYLGVRISAAECLGAMGENAKEAQDALAKAAISDKEPWVRAAASSSLTAVKADNTVMIPLYESMIRSTEKEIRAEGIKKAGELCSKGVDITPMIPALMDVFRKPIYDANFSGATRVPAMVLLNKMKVDTRELVPFIANDLKTAWKITNDGYHPYQKMTLAILGGMGANGEAAIPVLEEIIANPSKAGCTPSHPDYDRFISISKESISKIRSELEKKEKK